MCYALLSAWSVFFIDCVVAKERLRHSARSPSYVRFLKMRCSSAGSFVSFDPATRRKILLLNLKLFRIRCFVCFSSGQTARQVWGLSVDENFHYDRCYRRRLRQAGQLLLQLFDFVVQVDAIVSGQLPVVDLALMSYEETAHPDLKEERRKHRVDRKNFSVSISSDLWKCSRARRVLSGISTRVDSPR